MHFDVDFLLDGSRTFFLVFECTSAVDVDVDVNVNVDVSVHVDEPHIKSVQVRTLSASKYDILLFSNGNKKSAFRVGNILYSQQLVWK